jgi:hypothetical protein
MKSYNEWVNQSNFLVATNAEVRIDNENRLWIMGTGQDGQHKTVDILMTPEQVTDLLPRNTKTSLHKPPDAPRVEDL